MTRQGGLRVNIDIRVFELGVLYDWDFPRDARKVDMLLGGKHECSNMDKTEASGQPGG